MKWIRVVILMVAVSMFTGSAWGQDIHSSLRSSFQLSVGLWTGRRMVGMPSSIYPDETKEFGNTFDAQIGYGYALNNRLDLDFSIGLLTGHSTNFVDPLQTVSPMRQTGLVCPILVSIRYFLPEVKTIRRVTPFLSAGLGLDMAYETQRRINNSFQGSQIAEFVPAARLGAGFSYDVDRHIRLTLGVNYYLMTGFTYAVGGAKVFNGADVSAGTDLMF